MRKEDKNWDAQPELTFNAIQNEFLQPPVKLYPFQTSLKSLFRNCSCVRFGRRLGGLGLVGPPPAKKVSFVFGNHGAKYHHAHDQKDQQENDSNNEDWHTSPLRSFWNAVAQHAVIVITDGCEPTLQAKWGVNGKEISSENR